MQKEKIYLETVFGDDEVRFYYALQDKDGNEDDEAYYYEVYSLEYQGTFDSNGNEVPHYTN